MRTEDRRTANRGSRAKPASSKADGRKSTRNTIAKKASHPATDEHASKRNARQLMQRAARRPRTSSADEISNKSGGRLFVTALARGMEVLGAFRSGDRALGNLELAERTGLPKPTISRITHTLTQLGYLVYDNRRGTYELGSRTLSLSYVAMANLDVRRIARPIMEAVADANNLHIALGTRDKLMILNVETCEGHGLVGLRLANGSRIPIATTAIGRAYLAAAQDEERDTVLDAVRRQHGEDWPMIRRAIETSIRDIHAYGFCTSVGEWRKDINAVGAAIMTPNSGAVYALSMAGPAYLVSQAQLDNDYGPALADAARKISEQLGAVRE